VSDIERKWFPLTGPVSSKRRVAITNVLKKAGPVDPLTGPKLALAGRVVTMDDAFRSKTTRSCMSKGAHRRSPGPRTGSSRLRGVAVVDTGGTLFPGLIELHNHLSYNALPLWAPVPKRFMHRGQWPDHRTIASLSADP
jgi:hypothetical protein